MLQDGDTTVARISLADGIGNAVVSRARQLQADVGAGVMPCLCGDKDIQTLVNDRFVDCCLGSVRTLLL